MKVKNEESSGSIGGSSGSKNGKGGGGGKGEMSKEELAAKQKRKKDREALREKEREKELVNAAAAKEREREKEKERERERKEKEKERERESKVDLSRCKRIKSSDERVLKLRGHTVAVRFPSLPSFLGQYSTDDRGPNRWFNPVRSILKSQLSSLQEEVIQLVVFGMFHLLQPHPRKERKKNISFVSMRVLKGKSELQRSRGIRVGVYWLLVQRMGLRGFGRTFFLPLFKQGLLLES